MAFGTAARLTDLEQSTRDVTLIERHEKQFVGAGAENPAHQNGRTLMHQGEQRWARILAGLNLQISERFVLIPAVEEDHHDVLIGVVTVVVRISLDQFERRVA
jgi:hypothetical protein